MLFIHTRHEPGFEKLPLLSTERSASRKTKQSLLSALVRKGVLKLLPLSRLRVRLGKRPGAVFRDVLREALYPSSSSLRSATPTATANSGPISESTGRINAGAEVRANGSASCTSRAKNSFA